MSGTVEMAFWGEPSCEVDQSIPLLVQHSVDVGALEEDRRTR
jgi:hypothetical protein